MMEEGKPQSEAASTAGDGGMTQSNICLNSAQIKHEGNSPTWRLKEGSILMGQDIALKLLLGITLQTAKLHM